MNFQAILKKLQNSKEFADFKKDNADCYLCAGFFVLDFESGSETKQLDFFIPKKNKIVTFVLNDAINLKIEDAIEKKLGKINPEIKIELPAAIEKAKKECKSKVNKIIAILQVLEGRQVWNLTCMLEGFSMLLLHVDSQSGEIIKKEKRNLFDFVKTEK